MHNASCKNIRKVRHVYICVCVCLCSNGSLLLQLQDAVEYAECEAVVKDFPPFREAMKKRGIEDMDLVMVDAW